MGVPISYSIRSLWRRRVTTVFTVAGIGLVVATFIVTQSLGRGIREALAASGHPLNYVVLRQGSTAENSSFVSREATRKISQLDGVVRIDRRVAAQRTGLAVDRFPDSTVPLAAPELLTMISLPRPETRVMNPVLVRGVTAVSLLVRPEIQVQDGRIFRPGLREAIAPKSLLNRFDGLHLGGRIRIGRSEYTIVGHFTADGSSFGSEIWTDGYDLGADLDRMEWSSLTFRARDRAAGEAIAKVITDDPLLSMKVLEEVAYYKEQMIAAAPISVLGGFLATLMSIGAVFAAMNTMYAGVAARVREIGTLKVLGFRPGAIERAFLLESCFLGLLGGGVGCLMAWPLNGLATGTANFVTFSELAFQFRITPDLMMFGVGFALVIGALGGYLPARSAARRPIMAALKEL